MTDAERHDHQHDLIDQRWNDYLRLTKERPLKRDRLLRRDAYRVAIVTLRGHLSSCHGYKHLTGPPQTLATLHAIHSAYHAQDIKEGDTDGS